jgi:hypothetical protein
MPITDSGSCRSVILAMPISDSGMPITQALGKKVAG